MATNTYVALNTTTLGSSASTITFSSIPQGYTDLVLVFQATAASANMNFDIRVGNGSVDSGSNYSDTYLLGGSGGAQSNRASNQDRLRVGNSAYIQSSGGVFTAITHFMNYSNTTTNKTMLSRDGNVNMSVVESSVGLWRSTAAINIITMGDFGGVTMAAGTTATLYGIQAQGVSPAAKATGGAIYSDDTYYYHVFGSTGTFTPLSSLTADVLVVAGGGGGGGMSSSYGVGAAGGGAGGFRALTSQSFTSTGYTVTVGAGGAGGVNNARGSSGANSSLIGGALSLSSSGGGGGATYNTPNGIAGGSGGGAAGSSGNTGVAGTGNAGSYTPVEGYAGGGAGSAEAGYQGAGGGGANGLGGNGSGTSGGNGGAGATSVISGGATTSIGVLSSGSYYLAGGGAGSSYNTINPGTATAGGANGVNGNQNGIAATSNTGGGGSGACGTDKTGGNGGSGVVIIRYAK